MTRSKLPATLVLCATAPRQTLAVRASSWLDAARAVAVPVTWVVGIDSLAGIASGVGDVDLALDIPPAACGSRSRLRDLLARARDITPGMTSVVLRGPTPPAHRGLLVEEGISVALVDTFDDDDARGNRRPAPKGWPCRNSVWGLWEVQVAAHRPGGLLGWLGFDGQPAVRRGGLQVLRTDGVSVGNNGSAFISPRLERWISWASQRRFSGAAVVMSLSAVPEMIAGSARESVAGSVLRAA
jgi:hypothetical protein